MRHRVVDIAVLITRHIGRRFVVTVGAWDADKDLRSGHRPARPHSTAALRSHRVGHMRLVQQAVEDRGGKHFVAGEQVGPVAHRLVGGVGFTAFRASIGLHRCLPAHPTAPPLSASCSSGQRFALSFLRIRGHPRHPCRSANTSPWRVCRALPPPSPQKKGGLSRPSSGHLAFSRAGRSGSSTG